MDRHVFRELLSARYGLVPGRLPGSVEYLGREIFMAVSSRSYWKERRKNLYGPMILCAAVLANLLMIGGLELNRGAVENIV
jgi:hypothetical protein